MAAPDNANAEQAGGLRPEGTLPPTDVRTGVIPPPSSEIETHRARTTSVLAYWLLGMLTATVVGHYVCIMILIFKNRADSIKNLEDFYHSWLPVLAGLAGSVVTYYFTREGK